MATKQTQQVAHVEQTDGTAMVARVVQMIEAGATHCHEKPIVRTRGNKTYRIARLPLTSWVFAEGKGYFPLKAIQVATGCTTECLVRAVDVVAKGGVCVVDYIGCTAEQADSVIREALGKRWENSAAPLDKGYSIYVRDRREPKPNLKGKSRTAEEVPEWLSSLLPEEAEEAEEADDLEQEQEA